MTPGSGDHECSGASGCTANICACCGCEAYRCADDVRVLRARVAALEHALPLLSELVEVCERGYFSGRWRWHLNEAREKFDAARAALEHELEQARDQETMWRERWEERHARVAALEHALEQIMLADSWAAKDIAAVALAKADNP